MEYRSKLMKSKEKNESKLQTAEGGAAAVMK